MLAMSVENRLYFWGEDGSANSITVPTEIEMRTVVDIGASRNCSISTAETVDGKVYFWGRAYGLLIPNPVLTKFRTMAEVFASLDTPMMLEPMEFPENEPIMLDKFRQSFDDQVNLFNLLAVKSCINTI